MNKDKTITLLIAAMGGEGGGVLTDWIVRAARYESLPMQATSIPGVAQRTGATTYYIELAQNATHSPTFCLSPMAGDIDIFASSEYLETGRAIQNGYVTPDKTFLISSTHRVYTLEEKMQSGEASFTFEKLQEAALIASHSSLLFDMQAMNLPLNALLLGAIATRLPLKKESFTRAIREVGLSVEQNLKAFAAGQTAAQQIFLKNQSQKSEDIRLQQACARLAAYQNQAYVHSFLKTIEHARTLIHDEEVIQELIRCLALRLSFEDIAYVAQIKSSRARFETVENEIQPNGKPYLIKDYFKPGVEEIAAFLPPRLGEWLEKIHREKNFGHKFSFGMTLKANSLFGFFTLKLLACLKFLRPYGWRFQQEQQQINAWIALILQHAPQSPHLGIEIIQLSELITGYGETYKRGLKNYDSIVSTLFSRALPADFLTQALHSARLAAQKDPEGPLLGQCLNEILQKIPQNKKDHA